VQRQPVVQCGVEVLVGDAAGRPLQAQVGLKPRVMVLHLHAGNERFKAQQPLNVERWTQAVWTGRHRDSDSWLALCRCPPGPAEHTSGRSRTSRWPDR
jgi:hypothetical protein